MTISYHTLSYHMVSYHHVLRDVRMGQFSALVANLQFGVSFFKMVNSGWVPWVRCGQQIQNRDEGPATVRMESFYIYIYIE